MRSIRSNILKTLDGHFAMNDSDFKSFTNDRELTRYWIHGDLTDASTPKLASIPCLEELRIDNHELNSEKTLLSLGAAMKLRSLWIAWKNPGKTSQDALDAIKSLPKLELLDISQQHTITDDVIRRLMPLHALRELNINHTSNGFVRGEGLYDTALEYIGDCPNLEVLDISGCEGFTGKGMAALSKVPRLRSLIARTTKIGDEGIRHIVQCRSLEVLDLDYANITDEGLKELQKLPKLKYLRIDERQPLTPRSIELLCSITSLVKLDIVGYRIDDAAVVRLSNLPHLRELYIGRNYISNDTERQVCAAHPNLKLSTRDILSLHYPPGWTGMREPDSYGNKPTD